MFERNRRPRPSVSGLVLAVWIASFSIGALGVSAPVAAAASPSIGARLTNAVTDETGVLAPDVDAIQAALQQLFDKTGVQLYVVFVNSTGGVPIADYAAQVGAQSNLSGRDGLLTVALADRTDNLTLGSDLRDDVSQTSLDTIRSSVLEKGLASGDYAGAVIRTAAALETALPPLPTAVPPVTQAPVVTPVPGSSGAGAGGSIGTTVAAIIAVIVIVVGFLLIAGRVVKLREERRAQFEEARQQEQLGRQANALLISTDDALRDTNQHLDFLEKDFGADQIAPMRTALASAKDELNVAFTLGQKLDDAFPETVEQRRQMIEEIIARCGTAQKVIDAQDGEAQRLSDLETNAPQVLQSLDAEAKRVAGLLDAVPAAQARLGAYADASTESVRGNLDTARVKLRDAGTNLEAGHKAVSDNKLPAAAVAAATAQKDLADATSLISALTNLADSLDAAAKTLQAQIADADKDLETARASVASSPAPGTDDSFTKAQSALEDARGLSKGPKPDVLAAARRATEANALTDQLLAGVRAAQVAYRRTEQNASAAIATARADISRATDYVNGYRHSQQIGREARNRLAEADRLVTEAQHALASDVNQALALARQADSMANQAYAYAQQDAPPPPPNYSSYGPNDGLGSLIAGAILGGILSGGGRGGMFGGGFGGSSRGASGGGFFGAGGFGSGGFGGGFGGGGGGGGFGGGRSSSGGF